MASTSRNFVPLGMSSGATSGSVARPGCVPKLEMDSSINGPAMLTPSRLALERRHLRTAGLIAVEPTPGVHQVLLSWLHLRSPRRTGTWLHTQCGPAPRHPVADRRHAASPLVACGHRLRPSAASRPARPLGPVTASPLARACATSCATAAACCWAIVPFFGFRSVGARPVVRAGRHP